MPVTDGAEACGQAATCEAEVQAMKQKRARPNDPNSSRRRQEPRTNLILRPLALSWDKQTMTPNSSGGFEGTAQEG